MKLSEFAYKLPPELIAQYPLKERDHARLMVIDRQNQTIDHDIFYNIGKHLKSPSIIVLNDSKVIPARLIGKREKTNGKVEVFLLKRLSNPYLYQTLIRPLRKIKVDEKIIFGDGQIYAQLKDVEKRIVGFNKKDISEYIENFGHIPLPPYIKRVDNLDDKNYYQTVFARKEGSVASPTAGLHFTKKLLNNLKKEGHKIIKVTLHINYATFKPVEEQDIENHKMHSEFYSVGEKSFNELIKAKKQKQTIVAIGTTSCRVLETLGKEIALGKNPTLKGNTDIFIYPGYKFHLTDTIVTNFHLPHSSLLMLVYAFGGTNLMKKAYKEAIKRKYRFYSYGDAMMII